ncbi:CYFA0S14e01332g1_1 [Cyberlindnera fabianii]|uniref:non-specific serine/threonine protein kinase n=1 Tax=Cyberlindnera fabianii TaxID=36022 RepID=A0A061B360_CYBFA|nr:CYFA0S14e01332g1_1 [Cyberlindnera fabianii]
MSTDTTSTTTTRRRQSFQGKPRKGHKEVRFGSYILGSTLGEGEFGKVKLGWRKDGSQPSQVAIKFIRRESIPRGSDRESKVHREINALKRLSHPNIIKLEEVLQNDKYIGIVLEYASGGELFDYILQHRYLKDSLACRLFAQLVSGVHYMHSKGIVHRDLKLENLLLDKHKNIIITDFGFVNSFSPGQELMKTSCGSPCYAAPELVISSDPYEARKVDIWSCGVILYAMLAGYLPFDDDPQNPDGDNIARLYQYITSTPLTFPEYIEPMPRDLLRRILVPNPKKRITLREIRSHQWLAPHAPFLSVTPSEWDKNTSTQSIPVPQPRPLVNDYRRYSLIDTSSVALHNTNVSQSTSFFASPLPPQTSSSHAIAIPSSTSSTSINEQVTFNPRGGHKRSGSVQSYSSASMALQAVVDADDIRHHVPQANSLNSSEQARRDSFTKKPSGHSVPRSTTHTGISSMTQKEQLINTAIEESPAKKPSTFVVPKIPTNSNNYHQPHPTQKLPGAPRKPRPTSYHPGLYSAQDSNNLDFQIHNHVPAQFGRSESTNSVASLSKISKPHVELALAEGGIITPKSPTFLSASLSHSPQKLEITEEEDKEVEDVDEKNTASEAEKKKTNRYSAVIAAEMVFDKIFGSASNDKPADTIQAPSSENLTKPSRSPSVQSSVSKPSTKSTGTKNTSVQGSPHDQARIPSGSKHTDTTNSNKTKRFSFLGFYNSQPDSKSNGSHEFQKRTQNTSTPKKKPLEPSTVDNIQTRRNSYMPKKKESVIAYTSFDQRKEPSTAKKVMDFFKRRSMRI